MFWFQNLHPCCVIEQDALFPGLGEIDGLHGTSTQSCILTYDLCTGEPLRRPKPAQDEWYVIMSGHPFIKALAAYRGGAFVQGLR